MRKINKLIDYSVVIQAKPWVMTLTPNGTILFRPKGARRGGPGELCLTLEQAMLRAALIAADSNRKKPRAKRIYALSEII